jgi:hypothetical protein
MGPWATWAMVDRQVADRRLGGPARRHRGVPTPGYGAGGRPKRRDQVSAWVGFRMIGLGCRLARPAVVGRAQVPR